MQSRDQNFPRALPGKETLTNPWFMEREGSIPHLQELLNNPYPEPNQPISSFL